MRRPAFFAFANTISSNEVRNDCGRGGFEGYPSSRGWRGQDEKVERRQLADFVAKVGALRAAGMPFIRDRKQIGFTCGKPFPRFVDGRLRRDCRKCQTFAASPAEHRQSRGISFVGLGL
jgi:hypothetical protein